MNKGKLENHEVRIMDESTGAGDLYFGLLGTSVNTTKTNKRKDSGIKEDLKLDSK